MKKWLLAVLPATALADATDSTVSLSDYAGQRVLVYFYPRANTPGCTKEACDFRDSLRLRELGAQVLGISERTTYRIIRKAAE